MIGETLTFAGTYFAAAHQAIEGGRMHGHTWRVRAYWPADGTDAIERQGTLHIATRELDHTTLPPELSRAEELSAWIGKRVGAAMCHVWREAEDIGAWWIAP